MSEFLNLAERCEKASGPDVDLNEAILSVLGWTSEKGTAFTPEGDWAFEIPDYTRSVDAAMELVPEEGGFDLRRTRTSIGIGIADVFPDKFTGQYFSARCANPALALTAAALRARAAA